ncbi:MAG TPA: 16S rRNA (cytidine(1402)-2'-O)-methyltransferase [Gemmatimonadaceae bacterium]|nr:16S rRNA (cytidine(1402)-2'-O)-methyltransferase [Gemmatimonadaceae bacterium]HTK50678.1 16S rRNA (cytidine(1402)-2'-O)-methyltransferase [Gemmatimonadaceae bacterium]
MTEPNETGALHVVSTPIGNMGDFSFRAVEVLKSVSLVLAEDTRHTRHLLDHYGIETPLAAYHEHNEARATPGLVARLVNGESLALVSDAGTPLLSDPGARLVRAAVAAGVRVIPVPGASALLAALVASGLDLERFTFFGFLTRTGRARRETLDEIANSRHTVVVYESANRLTATLAELEKLGNGARPAVVAREMTKLFEEVQRGTVDELRAYYEGHPPRGEIVLMLGGRTAERIDDELVRERLRDLRKGGMSARDAAALVSRELGVPRNLAYRLAQASDTGEEIG